MTTKPTCTCTCGAAPKLIFACSGCADVGSIADQAARKMSSNAVAKMSCLAGIGARISGFIKSAEAASAVLVIDGCSVSFAKKSFEQAGLTRFEHLQIADLGLTKGASPISNEAIDKVVTAGTQLLNKAVSV